MPPRDLDALLRESRLHSERAARPPLAGEAVAHRDADGIARGGQPERPAAASGLAGVHGLIVRG
jgi:hypothetical protein